MKNKLVLSSKGQYFSKTYSKNGHEVSRELIKIFKTKIKFKSLFLHEPDLDKSEVNYLNSCIRKNTVSSIGKFVKKFENKISKLTKAKYVITTNSGTSALHISCILMGIKDNDEVLLPSFTFVGTANAVKYCNAIPHFVDIEEKNFGINVEKLESYLNNIAIKKKDTCINKLTGRKIKAIIPVHVFGHPVEIDGLIALAKKFNLSIIEDAAEAIGSYYKNQHVGTFGDIGIISFNGNKTITCGSGGAILTNNKILAQRARHLISTAKIPHSYKYIHDEVGFNYRLPNLNAALGYSQIKRIKTILNKKRKLFLFYKKIFKNDSIFKLVNEPINSKSNFWLQTILISKNYSNLTRTIIEDLKKKKIYVRPGWELMTKLNFFRNCPKMNLSISEKICKRIINIPSSSFLVNYLKKL